MGADWSRVNTSQPESAFIFMHVKVPKVHPQKQAHPQFVKPSVDLQCSSLCYVEFAGGSRRGARQLHEVLGVDHTHLARVESAVQKRFSREINKYHKGHTCANST